ncbi:hypothetical protein [Streptosporangium carneum]|uniref:Uncharacterized protein n=1 Tax=Streptosporangium carneum TaxID=47481 RepID=A0A9W6HZT3_9ACTN|nr:hypothetical protein [Streptosporangium carneum]GLK09093.1 hypothetical protein GCM10017600_24990 [Streptosporangium carneum]
MANTVKAYSIALRALTAELGEQAPLAELEGEAGADRVARWFTGRRGGAAAGAARPPRPSTPAWTRSGRRARGGATSTG